MTTFAQRRRSTPRGTANGPAEKPVAAPVSSPNPGPSSAMALRLSRPTRTSVAVHVAGDLDADTAPRLHELLAPRLASAAEIVILDLSELRFLGLTGLRLLDHAHRHAACRAMTVRIVDGPVCVDRALRAAGWRETMPTYPSVAAAVAGPTGRRHGMRAVG